MSLNTLQENATRFGMRLQESISEHTRDLNFGRPSGVSFFDTSEDKVKNIRKQLESGQDNEKLEAMKRLIAMISKGRNVTEFFAQVVKNVASQNLEIRKLVYIYLLRYTEQEPDLALLSINTFQKDISDSNPLIRSMALRVLSGIKVPMIGSIVVLGIKKCAADPNPYVRKAAALAIPKLIGMDSSHLSALESTVLTLLRDRSPVSIGYVAEAFNTVFAHRLDLLHGHYRRLCRILVDVDEWGQIFLMNLLLRYAKQMLPKPKEGEEEQNIDADLLLLLNRSEPLFHSRNPAVLMTVCRLYHVIRGSSSLEKILPSLLRLCDSEPSPEIRRVVLSYVSLLATESRDVLRKHSTRFYVRTRDPNSIKSLKLKILLQLVSPDNVLILLREIKDYSLDTDDAFVTESIRAIGRCAAIVPDSTQHCLNILIEFIQSPYGEFDYLKVEFVLRESLDTVVGNAVMVLKSLIQACCTELDVSSNLVKSLFGIIGRLAYHVEAIHHPDALACSLWLIGQYAGEHGVAVTERSVVEGVADWAPDVLRKMAKRFSNEACPSSSGVKLQIITLAAKLQVLNRNHNALNLLSRYVFSLARYDMDYDIRDRARILGSLLLDRSTDSQEFDRGGVILRREQTKAVLFSGKSYSLEKEVNEAPLSNVLGSLGPILGQPFFETDLSMEWYEQGAETTLRDTEDDISQSALSPQRPLSSAQEFQRANPIVLTPGGVDSPTGSYLQRSKWIDLDLDKFYESDDDKQEDEEEEKSEDDSDEDEDEEDEDGGENENEIEDDETGDEDQTDGGQIGQEGQNTKTDGNEGDVDTENTDGPDWRPQKAHGSRTDSSW